MRVFREQKKKTRTLNALLLEVSLYNVVIHVPPQLRPPHSIRLFSGLFVVIHVTVHVAVGNSLKGAVLRRGIGGVVLQRDIQCLLVESGLI